MGRRENLAARSFSAGCGRDTASRAPPRVCAPKDQRNARRVLFTNGGKTNAPDFARTFYEVRKDNPDTTHSL